MHPKNTLPGLDRLIAVLEKFGMAPTLPPPSPKAPHAGDRVLGASFDAQLAALYACTNSTALGDLLLYGFDDKPDDNLVNLNTDLRTCEIGHPFEMSEIVYYAQEANHAYRFAVVPSLTNVEGVQPVLYLDEYETPHIYPLASSVDRAFDLWAQFSEMRLKNYGRLDTWMLDDVYEHITYEIILIAQDKELVRMMKAGNFDRFIGDDREMRAWMESIIRAAGG